MRNIENDFNYKKLFNTSRTELNNNQKLNKENDVSLFKADNENRVNKSTLDDLLSYFSNDDSDIQDINYSKDRIRKLPDGISRFDYNGARYTIFKRDDEYRSEFHAPGDFDFEDFVRHFPDLPVEPVMPSDDNNVVDDDNIVDDNDAIEDDGIVDNDNVIDNEDDESNEAETVDLKINGEFDETTIQGNTGDCWILTGLKALSSTEAGKEIIKNSIKVNDDNTVTVIFAGVGVSYTISADEILAHDTDDDTSDSYSNGDNDILAFELAVEYLLSDINSGNVKLNTDNENITEIGDSIDDGGLPSQLIYFLTGNESTEKYNDDLSDLNSNDIYSILENASDNSVITIGIYNDVHSCTLTDGSTYSLNVGNGGHALSITNIDKTNKTVTMVNPWDSSYEYTMSWDEFVKLGIGYISSTDVSLTNMQTDIENINVADDYSSNSYNDYGNDYSNNFMDFDFYFNKYDKGRRFSYFG